MSNSNNNDSNSGYGNNNNTNEKENYNADSNNSISNGMNSTSPSSSLALSSTVMKIANLKYNYPSNNAIVTANNIIANQNMQQHQKQLVKSIPNNNVNNQNDNTKNANVHFDSSLFVEDMISAYNSSNMNNINIIASTKLANSNVVVIVVVVAARTEIVVITLKNRLLTLDSHPHFSEFL